MMRIAVIGERFLDRSFVGTTDRLSPEFPGPVVKVNQIIEQPGGASNVAENLRALGVDVVDIYQPGHTPVKNRLFAGTQQIARWDTDDWTSRINIQLVISKINNADGVIISDYCKGALTPDNIEDLSHIIKSQVFIDTKTDPIRYVHSPNALVFEDAFFFPNFKEYSQFLNSYISLDKVIRKDGASGLKYYEGAEFVFEVPALAKKVVSVNGAGDTVIAAFAYAVCSGKSIIEAAEFASRAAAVAVAKPLTAVATLEEIEEFDESSI